MNEQACKDLQFIWDELQKFRFDLTWVEPHFQYALGMKSYVEKVLQLEKLKENMVTLELETERLKAKMDVAELKLYCCFGCNETIWI
ncbi:MATH domain and coiled-coil domain-containing protein [Trifolium repens]|nr:MATH domain and coiled-coil domain-containing protein [Trifolium repens]